MYCFSTITLCELKLWSVLFFFSTYTTPSLSIVDYFIKTFSFTMKFFSKTFFSASAASHFKYYLKPEKNNSFIFSYSKKGFTLHYLYITLCRKFSNKNICFFKESSEQLLLDYKKFYLVIQQCSSWKSNDGNWKLPEDHRWCYYT